MLVENQKVKVKWGHNNKQYYISSGYKFTKYGDEFEVDIKDLKTGSNTDVHYVCDYCGEPFVGNYNDRNMRNKKSPVKKDACKKCAYKKREETCLVYYGVKSPMQFDEIKNKSINNRKITYEIVKQEFTKHGYTLITTKEEYRNLDTESKLKFICPVHGLQDYGTYNKLKFMKSGCKWCGRQRGANKRKKKIDRVKEEFFKRNFLLLEEEYTKQSTPMKFICLNHPEKIQTKTYKSFKQGTGCIYCFYDQNKGDTCVAWKGGVTPLHLFLRGHLKPWKKDSMKACNYKCAITGKNFDVIHHIYSFNKIIKEVLQETNLPLYDEINKYSEEELELLKNTCLQIHYKYPFGVCLNEKVHNLYHYLYGDDNDLEQFEEFKEKYINGEFKEVI